MRWSFAVVVVIACGGSARPVAPPSNRPAPAERGVEPAPPPRPIRGRALTDAEFDRLVRDAVTMFTKMGVVADAAGTDCGKLATGVEQVMNQHRPFIASMKGYKENPDLTRRLEAWMEDHQAAILDPMMKVTNASSHCMNHPRFKATLERLGAIGD